MSFDQQVRHGLIANSAHLEADTDRALVAVLSRARRRRAARQAGFALVAAVALLAGSTWLPTQLDLVRGSTPPIAPADSRPALPFGTAARTIDVDRVSAARHGFPQVSLTVPDGWSDLEHRLGRWGVWTSGEDDDDFLAVSVWEGWMILRHQHPCTWFGHDWTPDGSPTEHPDGRQFTQILRAAGADVTEPVRTDLAGVPAEYLEYTLPADYQCRSRADLVVDPLDKSWVDPRGEQGIPGPGQVHRLWVLTLAGTSVVVDATHTAGASDADVDSLMTLASSIGFASDPAP